MNTAYVDWERSACLCDVGMPGWAAATCVGVDGQQHLVLVDEALLGDERHTYDHTTPQARHEQPGPLPHGVRYRVWQVPARRCGRRTKAGLVCRTRVARPGDTCVWHREQAALDLLADQLGAKPIDPERGTNDE